MKKHNPVAKFAPGDLVRHTTAHRRSVGMYGGYVDGVVVGTARGLNFPVVYWSEGNVSPVNPANLEKKKGSVPAVKSVIDEGRRLYEEKMAKEPDLPAGWTPWAKQNPQKRNPALGDYWRAAKRGAAAAAASAAAEAQRIAAEAKKKAEAEAKRRQADEPTVEQAIRVIAKAHGVKVNPLHIQRRAHCANAKRNPTSPLAQERKQAKQLAKTAAADIKAILPGARVTVTEAEWNVIRGWDTGYQFTILVTPKAAPPFSVYFGVSYAYSPSEVSGHLTLPDGTVIPHRSGGTPDRWVQRLIGEAEANLRVWAGLPANKYRNPRAIGKRIVRGW